MYGKEFEDAIYVIEVDFFDFSEKVRLYRDGFLVDEGVSPVVLMPLTYARSLQNAIFP